MAIGGDAANRLWQAAVNKQFTLDPNAAHELAGHYQWYAEEMVERQHDVVKLRNLEGFGGFDSANQLQSGFGGKAAQAFEALKGAEESAYRMKAAILQAANLLEEVDKANSAAIAAANRKMPNAKF